MEGNPMMDQINSDIKGAMKSKNKERLNALRYLKSKLLENKTAKNPKPELDVVISHCKKLKDSIDAFPAGSEKRDEISKELSHLEPYMPKAMSEQEVKDLIGNIIQENENPSMGVVMKALQVQIKGKFDGKRASELVRETLNSGK